MEEEQNQNLEEEILHTWEIKEYEVHERGTKWYIVASVILAVLIIYAIVTKNFLFALLVLLFAVLMFMEHAHEPLILPFTVTKKGIGVNNKLYPYESLKSFWIIDEPPFTRHLYFEFKNSLKPPMGIFLGEEDMEEIRETLSEFILEDKEKKEEPFSNWLWRMLKI